jgi:activator of HSP90 ATPase
MESFEISFELNCEPETLYRAWLDPCEHAAFTESDAEIEPVIEGSFSIWDGYITGKTVEMQPYSRIVQKWRTTEFPESNPDSTLEIKFEKKGKGTKFTLIHTEIPDGQGEMYKKGWNDYYFKPMTKYYAAPGR